MLWLRKGWCILVEEEMVDVLSGLECVRCERPGLSGVCMLAEGVGYPEYFG